MMLLAERPDDSDFFNLLTGLSSSGSRFDLNEALKSVVTPYGLKNAAYFVINLPGQSHRDPEISVTYSDAWVRRYFEANYIKCDPVLTVGLSSIMPVDWHLMDQSTKRVRQMFGEARELDVGRHGMSFPIRGNCGEKAIFSITSDTSDEEWRRSKLSHMRDFQILSHHIHRMVLTAKSIASPTIKLAPRELECLRWAAMGKTTAETGAIIGIGNRTVRFYLELARYKLDAVNITNAVAKAISLNMISVGL